MQTFTDGALPVRHIDPSGAPARRELLATDVVRET